MALPLGLQVHQEHEDDPWTINIPDHTARTDSPGFRASKKLAHAILATLGMDANFYGIDNLQMHHGGSLWLNDGTWFMVQNEAGIEWSAQFCTDPSKADALRQNAARVYAGFPKSILEMVRLGYGDAKSILETSITDADGIATWGRLVQLVCSAAVRTAYRATCRQEAAGTITQRPLPTLSWSSTTTSSCDPQSNASVAVVPTAPRGANVRRVRVIYAPPDTDLGKQHDDARAQGKPLEFGAGDALTEAAFALQPGGAVS